MAHFAKISEDNIVLQVLVVNDQDVLDENNNETESVGKKYLETHNNWPAHLWIQTSYNTRANQHRQGGTPFRGNYANIGYTWDPSNNIFKAPQPFPSWSFDLTTATWQPPVEKPVTYNDEEVLEPYNWDEENQQWVKLSL